MFREVGLGFVGVLFILSTPFGKPIGFFTAGEILILLAGIVMLVAGGYLVEKNKKTEVKRNE